MVISNYHLFQPIKKMLGGQKCSSHTLGAISHLSVASTAASIAFASGIQKLVAVWENV